MSDVRVQRGTLGGYHGRGLHGEVVEELGRRILAGEFAEGQILEIGELEAQMEVSRSVMREALRVLKAKGLVDARQKRGTFVQPRSEWRLLDADVMRWQFQGHDSDQTLLDNLAELRGIIEPAAAGLAALRRTDDDIAGLDAALGLMSAAAQGVGDAVRADLTFHRAVLAATHNELLIRTEIVLQPGLAARDEVVHAVADDDPTPAHAAVRDAIRDGAPDAAAAAASALLAKSLLDLDRIRGEAWTLPTRRPQ